MLRIRNSFFLSLFIVILIIPYYANADRGLSVQPISPTGAEVAGDQWLFVIGIDTYIHWPRLKTAVNDAKAVKDVLLNRYYFDKDHLIELFDEQATRKNIIGKLRYLANNVREGDSLFIFYAGHGHLDSITKEGSWIPIESGTKDASAWITNHDIKNYLKIDAIKAKHILLISDSCFAGDFFRGHRGKLPVVTEKVIKKAYQLSSRQAITSGGLEPVSDAGFGNNSVFSHFLVNTLKENQKPFLVPSDIFPYIKAGVAENAEQFPQFGSLKGTGGQQGGELVLFLKQKSRLKDLSAAASKKSDEFERLRQMEIEAKATKKKEEAEIAKRERELATLDAKISEMKKRLGTTAAQTDDSLDAMLAMVQQKEAQQQRIDELKKQRQAEEAKRKAEIEQLKKEKQVNRVAAIKADIAKYEKIVASPFGKDMKVSAWKSLIDKYPEAKGVAVGNTELLLAVVKHRRAGILDYAVSQLESSLDDEMLHYTFKSMRQSPYRRSLVEKYKEPGGFEKWKQDPEQADFVNRLKKRGRTIGKFVSYPNNPQQIFYQRDGESDIPIELPVDLIKATRNDYSKAAQKIVDILFRR